MTTQPDDRSLDAIFSPGPVGFLDDSEGPSRLRRFVCAMNPGLSLEPPKREPAASAGEPEAVDDPEYIEEEQGADAWRADAHRCVRALWSGDSRSIQPVFGFEAPQQFAAFERDTLDSNPWSTFVELRLDAPMMGNPTEDRNLFEMCVLNDQLNYLGTALPSVFAGVVCIGTLGNGDGYYLALDPDVEEPHAIYFFDHETHCLDEAFSVDLESLVYLTALSKAVLNERISDGVAKASYRALHGKVSPSWHFSIDELDEEFQRWEQDIRQGKPFYHFGRSLWIVALLRQDIEDLPGAFYERLNGVLSPKDLPKRLEIAGRSPRTALYATWRAYLFDEPELSQYLDVCREHRARIVRDAAKLIDELRGGRTSLGRIKDWPRLLSRFRALDLDPRRAAEREEEQASAQATLEEERDALREQIAGLESDPDAEVDFIAERLARPALHSAILHILLANPSRAKAKRGMEFLLHEEYSRGHSIFRHEQRDARRFVARHADPALMLLILGMALYQGPAEADEPGLSARDAAQVVIYAPETMPEAGRQALRDELEALDLEDPPGFRETLLVQLAGGLGDKRMAPALRFLARQIPAEGGFETALHFDDFVAEIAIALRPIGEPDAATELAPFATSRSPDMRDARVESALTIAAIAPEAFTDEMAERALEFMAQVNDGQENAKALLAIAGGKPGFPGASEAQPMADSYPHVRLAKALAQSDSDEAKRELETVFTKHGWRQEYTIEQRQFGMLVQQVLGLSPPPEILEAATGLDPDLDLALAELGGFQPPRWLTWFDVETMDFEKLREVLVDPSVRGRSYAARRLCGDEASRAALEAAVQTVLERRFDDDAQYLLQEAVTSLVALPEAESTVALCDLLLRHQSRELKDQVLRESPPWKGLKTGMEFVRKEKWGWQESAAREWLKTNG